MNTIGCNAPISERLRYAPHTLTEREVCDALRELEDWRATADEFSCSDSEELGAYIDKLEAKQCKDHEDYDELKEFFQDCVSSLNKRWPAAEPYDQNLRQVIMNAITRGDVEEEECIE